MARYIGDQFKAVMLFESGTYASVSGTGQWLGLVDNNDIQENVHTDEIRYGGQTNRDVGQFVNLAIDAKGKAKIFPQDFRSLAFALGSCVDGSGTGLPYSHTMTAIDNNVGNAFTSGTLNPFMSFTIEDSNIAPGTGKNSVKTINGCVIDTWELSGKGGGKLELNVDYIGQAVTYSSGTPTAATAATTRPFLWSDLLLHLPSGTVINEIRDWSLKVGNSFNAPHYNNGSQVIAVPVAENRTIELNLTVDSTSERFQTFYSTYYKGGSSFNSLLALSCPEAGAGSRDCMITLSGARVVDMGDPSKATGTMENKIKIKAQTISAVAHDLIPKYNPW